jgi:hypothetical protein
MFITVIAFFTYKRNRVGFIRSKELLSTQSATTRKLLRLRLPVTTPNSAFFFKVVIERAPKT